MMPFRAKPRSGLCLLQTASHRFLNKYLVNQIELRIIDADFITLHPSFTTEVALGKSGPASTNSLHLKPVAKCHAAGEDGLSYPHRMHS